MDLSRILLPPEISFFKLLLPLLTVVEFVVVVFLGVALVSTVLSLLHQPVNRPLARDFALVIGPGSGVWIALGILPLVMEALLLAEILHGSRFDVLSAMLLLLPLGATAIAALWLHRQRLNPILGVLGVLGLLAFLPPFITLLDFARRPEQWPLWNPLLPDLYNTLIFPRLAIFGVGSLLATGAVLLGTYFWWPERRLAEDVPHRPVLRLWATVLTHLGAILLPALVIWDFALPAWGYQSVQPVKDSAPMLALLWVTALGTGVMLLRGHAKRAGLWALLALVALGFEVNRQHRVLAHAVADHLAALRTDAEKRFLTVKQEQEARYASNTPLSLEDAARIYAERCASCHAFDRKVVGPPHQDVLPKYRGNPDQLAGYILNPVKVNPDYPSMPALGLAKREAVAVAKYLLAKLDGELPAANAEPAVPAAKPEGHH